MKSAPMMKVILTGPFTEGEVWEIGQLLRQIEQRDRGNIYSLEVDTDPSLSQEETQDLVRRLFPKVEGRQMEIVTIDYSKDGKGKEEK